MTTVSSFYLLLLSRSRRNLGVRYLDLVSCVIPVARVDGGTDLARRHPFVTAVAQDVSNLTVQRNSPWFPRAA